MSADTGRTRVGRDIAQPIHPCHNIDGDAWTEDGCDVEVYVTPDLDPDEPGGVLVSIETGADCECGCGRTRPLAIRLHPSHAAALAARIVAAVEITRPHAYCDHCSNCSICGEVTR